MRTRRRLAVRWCTACPVARLDAERGRLQAACCADGITDALIGAARLVRADSGFVILSTKGDRQVAALTTPEVQ